jgi:two-component system sensor histidine kinase KdpD
MNLFNSRGNLAQYAYSIGIVFLVAGVCFGLNDLLNYKVVAFILLVTVSLIAISFDILPVLLSAVLSAFTWNFFFIPPRFTLHVHDTEDTILFTMYFIIAMINAMLTYKIRQVEKAARLKEERANSVKLYNTILNSLSHELRTPIATIIGATDNLQTNHNLTEDNRTQLLNEVSRASLRLNQQVENLLNISRLESGHIQPKSDWCDITELVYDVVKRVEENSSTKKISISVNQSMPLYFLDKGMLDQVLYNLVNNAAIHTPAESSVAISASSHADLLEITIEDTGSGFKADEAKNVYHKFSRQNAPRSSGSGLGLSIVKGFTEALGGNVVLQKGSTGGARFTVSIPAKTSYLQ